MSNEKNSIYSELLILCLLWSLLSVLLASCASTPVVQREEDTPLYTKKEITLSPGDVIEVKFRFWPELNESQTVRPDGRVSLQLIDEVVAAGLTTEALDKKLTDLYKSKIKDPEITIFVRSLANQNVYVGGEVMRPGLFPLQASLTPLQAIINAGGFNDFAKPEGTIVIRKGKDNNPVPIEIDLADIRDGDLSSNGYLLQPNDVVYVPKTKIAKMNKFVNQYIEKLFLFRGVSLGFSYELHDASVND